MPSPAPSRQLEPAASQDSIDGLLAAPQPEVQLTNGYSESWQGQLDQLGHDFEDFFLDMFKEPNGLDSFHPQHRSLANVFCRGSPSLSYQSAAIFIKHWAATSGARLGRPLHVDSTELKVRLLQQYTKHMTGEPFDPTTFKQLIAYCRGELQVKLSLGHRTSSLPGSFRRTSSIRFSDPSSPRISPCSVSVQDGKWPIGSA